MIRRLRRNLTLLVLVVLLLISVGIVAAINYANMHSIAVQAESSLDILSQNADDRLKRTEGEPPEKPSGEEAPQEGEPPEMPSNEEAQEGEPPQRRMTAGAFLTAA